MPSVQVVGSSQPRLWCRRARSFVEESRAEVKPPVLRPPSNLGTYSDEGYPSWVREVGPWEHLDPPEDRALEPRLDWGEFERLAVEVEYLRAFGWVLDRGELYEFSWPPEGRLVREGQARSSTPECAAHGEELEPACDERQGPPDAEVKSQVPNGNGMCRSRPSTKHSSRLVTPLGTSSSSLR